MESSVSRYEDPSRTNYLLVIPQNNMKNSVSHQLSQPIEGIYIYIQKLSKQGYVQVKKKEG